MQCYKYNGIVLLFRCSVVSDSLQPHGLQYARLPCPSASPRVCSNSCPLSRWCHPTISASVNGILLSKKEWNLAFSKTEMDLEGIRSERKREMSYDFTYIWKLKKQMDKQNKTGTELQIQRTDGCQKGSWWGEARNKWDREAQISSYKITNLKPERYSMGNTVNNYVTSLYGYLRCWTYCGWSFWTIRKYQIINVVNRN